jgi:hypothetical protein
MARPFLRGSITACWLLVLVAALPARARDLPVSCTCPLGFGNWMRFEDSNSSPNMPDFWALESLDVDEISICSHGISFVFLTRQNDNLVIASLFFPEPNPEFVESRFAQSGRSKSSLEGDRNRLVDRYNALRWRIEEQFGSAFDEYGRVVFREMESGARPKILDPLNRLALRWSSNEFELRGYLDVYFTQMM